MSVALEPLTQSHFEQLHCLFDAVCRERRFLAFTHAGPREETFAFYQGILDRSETYYVAVEGNLVLGWCDVLRQFAHVRQHIGTLGMAVAASHRGRGVGKVLITKAIEHASMRGLTRIELTVHSQNVVAQSLYASVGFKLEGTQRNAWLMDGVYFDVHSMARLGVA
jgi:ribosomal protein S18 acetylase RimI-like enzyme